ncbi:uncharacterized protein DUF1707 [Geodermatophilus tzadiensis]|uniref:Uncharacterized protein DUF1707 n=2 Tax=Geodermatophilus tzadiensis TaxID=1137988 RepID=A0A2T0TPZ3_9ACTN|nr:uncharacterized protein DUF1707 [Geodermatophilus tzadiensis]
MPGMGEPVRAEELRVSDVERSAVQERLRRAVGHGQLDLAEFDERARAVWAARTRGELDRITRDLPEPPPPPPPAPRHRVFSDTAGGTAMRVLSTIWLSLVAVNVVAWTLVSFLADGAVHPWFVWFAPSGAVLAVLYATGIGRPRRPAP